MASPMPRLSAQREPHETSEDGQTHHHPGDVVADMARMETMQHVHRAEGCAQGRHPLGQTAAVEAHEGNATGQQRRGKPKRQADPRPVGWLPLDVAAGE